MIKIEKEPSEMWDNTGVYERCHFCKQTTDTWHLRTNTPICAKCAETRKVKEIKKHKPTKR